MARTTELVRDSCAERLTPDLVLVCPEARESQLARLESELTLVSSRELGGQSGLESMGPFGVDASTVDASAPAGRVPLRSRRAGFVLMVVILVAVGVPLLGHETLTETGLTSNQAVQIVAAHDGSIPRAAAVSTRNTSAFSRPRQVADAPSALGRVMTGPLRHVGSSTEKLKARGTAGTTRLGPASVVDSDTPAGPSTRRAPKQRTAAFDADNDAKDAAKVPEEEEEHEPIGIPGLRAPTGPFLAPDAGMHVVAPPSLSWDPIANVRAYRLRLFRGTREVLEVSTFQPSVTLARSWTYRGVRQTLRPGSYRWDVMSVSAVPTHGSEEKLLKRSSFVLIVAGG